jgi:glycosyltransferase involved in cell wall biosynthesis
MGEYARCLSLAQAVVGRWPGAKVHFLLSERAPYARATPFPYTLFPDSPTLHAAEGARMIRSLDPDVVVFDNAGRRVQVAAAHDAGAAVVYISARPRQRGKAFRLRWMRMLDEHWIPYPEFAGGALTRVERLKLRLMGRPRVRYLDDALPRPDEATRQATLARVGVDPERYVLLVPGGGTPHPGAKDAPAVYLEAARRIADAGRVVVALGLAAPDGAFPASLRLPGRVPPADVAALLGGAQLVVTNGGDTLLQALAFGRACVAAPIARDQSLRLRRCAGTGAVEPVALDAAALAGTTLTLLADEQRLSRMAAAARGLGLKGGVATALAAFEELLGRRAGNP